MKSRLLFVFLIFCFSQFLPVQVEGQTYTTTGMSTNWSDAAAWTMNTSSCVPLTTGNGGPPPPRTLNPGNTCPVKIVINHPITFTGNSTLGGGYMDSLLVNTGGNLTFTGNLTLNNATNSVGPFSITVRGGGVMTVSGNFTNQNGASVRLQSAGKFNVGNSYLTVGSPSSLSIDGSSSMVVANNTTVESGNTFSVAGNFTTTNFSTGGGGIVAFNGSSQIKISNTLNHLNGSITLSDQSNLSVENTLNMNGSAILALSGNTDISVGGGFNMANGTVNNSGNGDIRVGGDFTMSGGSTYNGSGESYLGVNGNHSIASNNPVNLTSNSKVYVEGNRTGNYWGGPSASTTSCYRANNITGGNGVCLPCSETFSNSNPSTFTVPPGVTSITIEAWGAGGAGGSITADGAFQGSGGGGGGGYSRSTLAVSQGESLAIYTGIAGSTSITSVSDGGPTYVTRDSNLPITEALLIARGGKSAALNSKTGGLGGGAATTPSNIGDVTYAGGSGGSATAGGGGGGGSSAGRNSSGNNGTVSSGGTIPTGGYGGGNGRSGVAGGNGNSTSSTYAGGGGGAYADNNTDRIGGAGKAGFVRISYSCPVNIPCGKYLDYGSRGDHVIIEYLCSGVWNAPKGLSEFGVAIIGGGGGGGYGSAAGGGGAGAVVTHYYSNINQKPANPPTNPVSVTYGLLENTNISISIGPGGAGGTTTTRGQNGSSSGISGSFLNYMGVSTLLSSSASGGGGGGSSITGSSNGTFNRNGLMGGSGGGGARSGGVSGSGGTAGTAGITKPGANASTGTNGIEYGAGGGGAGSAGSASAGSSAGAGGLGTKLSAVTSLSSLPEFYAGGGGGTMIGGLANSGGSSIGGNGNNLGRGQAGLPNTGSGGGAGSTGGGLGGSGKVFIFYESLRILPVEFLSFTASYQKGTRSAVLDWATAKEWENDRFEIERAANTVKDWEKIGQVKGAGYSDQPLDYTYQDLNLPLSGGTIFYRLKQRDFDGDSSYSETKSIRVDAMPGSSYWRAYPNPTTGDPFQLELLDSGIYNDEPITVRIISSTGKFGLVESKPLTSISTLLSAYLASQAEGVYVLEISWGAHLEYHKVILKR